MGLMAPIPETEGSAAITLSQEGVEVRSIVRGGDTRISNFSALIHGSCLTFIESRSTGILVGMIEALLSGSKSFTGVTNIVASPFQDLGEDGELLCQATEQ
jgi:hypothetical protein